MNSNELKLRIVQTLNDLVDVYFADETIIDKMANSTLKVLIELNISKIDEFLSLFKDNNGNIDGERLVNMYADKIPANGIKFDIRDYVKSDVIRCMLPDKSLLINKEDVLKITKTDNCNNG